MAENRTLGHSFSNSNRTELYNFFQPMFTVLFALIPLDARWYRSLVPDNVALNALSHAKNAFARAFRA
ncbi:MAG: hypothetical protein V7676_14310 [Parasphingorhabdus sp.]|uniref:hypothetical protein n=1 Tax=Parasphingorhabdus sp. TaxID=2709688 RepID=UPI0030012195